MRCWLDVVFFVKYDVLQLFKKDVKNVTLGMLTRTLFYNVRVTNLKQTRSSVVSQCPVRFVSQSRSVSQTFDYGKVFNLLQGVKKIFYAYLQNMF